MRVTPRLFSAIDHLMNLCSRQGECGGLSAKPHPERAKFSAPRNDLVTFGGRSQPVRLGRRDIDRVLVMAEMKRWSELEAGKFARASDLVTDMNRVLEMRHRNAFLDREIADVVNPDGHPI